jgi:hypothetical protein
VAEVPSCAAECVGVLRSIYDDACKRAGVPTPEVHITHVPPLVKPLYEELRMTCPHGVTWHMQPTSEQIAEWARDGVE